MEYHCPKDLQGTHQLKLPNKFIDLKDLNHHYHLIFLPTPTATRGTLVGGLSYSRSALPHTHRLLQLSAWGLLPSCSLPMIRPSISLVLGGSLAPGRSLWTDGSSRPWDQEKNQACVLGTFSSIFTSPVHGLSYPSTHPPLCKCSSVPGSSPLQPLRINLCSNNPTTSLHWIQTAHATCTTLSLERDSSQSPTLVLP